MTLNTLYKKLNKRWFGNKLPEIVVKYVRFKDDTLDGLFLYNADNTKNTRFRIHISDRICKDYEKVCLTLLHEMVHMKIYLEAPKRDKYRKTHGRRFQLEMRSLAARGAMDDIW